MTPAAGLCRGCGRTLEEIGDWFSMSDEERRAVMEELAGTAQGAVFASQLSSFASLTFSPITMMASAGAFSAAAPVRPGW